MEAVDREPAAILQNGQEEASSQTELTGEGLALDHKCEVRLIEKIVEVPIEILGAGPPLSPRMATRPLPIELQVMRVIPRFEPIEQIFDRLLEALTEDLANSEQHLSNLLRRVMDVAELKHSLERVLAGQRKTWEQLQQSVSRAIEVNEL